MYISLNWLKQYVDIPKTVSPEELGLKLTMSTVEIDDIKKLGENMAGIVVGKVLKVSPHPNADKLRLAVVDDGKEKVNVVCGGENLKEGMLVPFARVGARVRWHGQGDPVTLETVKIRGEESRGMICASDEIGLKDSMPCGERDILDLSAVLNEDQVGLPVAEALEMDDIIYEVDNKSITHRPDLWGHYGLAREIAAFLDLPLKNYNQDLEFYDVSEDVDLKVNIEEPEKCFRYCGIAMKNIKVGPSPKWLKKYLESVGVRSINNIVDITNYIMLGLGQPMHAFDKSKFKGDKIIVRNAARGEKLYSLDDVERELDESMLVIADEEKGVAIAGVMGGANTEIDGNTDTIILESANFDQVNVRKTSMKLGLRTESSMRFEKSLDPYNAMPALVRAVHLIKELCPEAEICSKAIDAGEFKLDQGPISVSLEFLQKRIGFEIGEDKIADILERLGFKVKYNGEFFEILVPTWRATKDISIPEDIVEEVARIYGYDNIETRMPELPIMMPLENRERKLERRIKNLLSAEMKMSEVMNYAFNGEKQLEKIGIDHSEYVRLLNPIASNHTLMCESLVPNLIANAVSNFRFFNSFKIFEISSIFKAGEKGAASDDKGELHLPKQDKFLSGLISEEGNGEPFYSARQAIDALLYKLGFEAKITPATEIAVWANPVRSADVMVGHEMVGTIAELHPRVSRAFGLKQRSAIFDINFSRLAELYSGEPRLYDPIPEFPPILRDLAIVADKKVLYSDIEKILLKPDLVKGIELFDIYEGESIGEEKKSLAFHITYQADRTLEAAEVDQAQTDMIEELQSELGARIRE